MKVHRLVAYIVINLNRARRFVKEEIGVSSEYFHVNMMLWNQWQKRFERIVFSTDIWKVHRALIKAKLEPYLGFLHSIQYGKPSLVCDFQELYRHLIDDFPIQYCQKLKTNDFTVKTEALSRSKTGKRAYLDDAQTRDLMKTLNEFFESRIEVPRIRVGNEQTVETLINEEASLFAKYLRNENQGWIPRIMIV